MLGVVYENLTESYWKSRLLTEMAIRVAKETVRTLMRLAMERIGLPTEEPYIRGQYRPLLYKFNKDIYSCG